MMQAIELAVLILIAATLYGSVGHAGASGYLAAMAFVGLASGIMKPTALVINILAASIVTLRFYRAGCFSWSTLWPFAVASIPMSFVGGAIHLPTTIYRLVVGVILFIAAVRLIQTNRKGSIDTTPIRRPPIVWAIFWGGIIGLTAGLTGSGGGIFLSPLLLFMGWAKTREASGVSAAFILVNSIAGLAGNLLTIHSLPPWIVLWCIAGVIGAAIGSELGARRLAPHALRYLLAVVLIIAGCKLAFVK